MGEDGVWFPDRVPSFSESSSLIETIHVLNGYIHLGHKWGKCM